MIRFSSRSYLSRSRLNLGLFATSRAGTFSGKQSQFQSKSQCQSWRTLTTISNSLNLNLDLDLDTNHRKNFQAGGALTFPAPVQSSRSRSYTNTPIHHLSASGRIRSRSRSRNNGTNSKKNSRKDMEKEKQFIQEANDLHKMPLGSLLWEDIQHAKRLIHRLTYTNNYTSVKKAEHLLERLVAEGSDSEGGDDGQEGGQNPSAVIEDKLYNIIIGAYGKCNHYDSASRAHDVFDRMTERYEASISASAADSDNDGDGNGDGNGNKKVKVLLKCPSPNIVTYNTLMNTWCNSRSEEAVERVEQLMAKMESDDAGVVNVQPDNISYNTLMNTYANQVNEYGYAQKAEDVLLKMSVLQKDGKADISPCTLSFNTVLKAWKNTAIGGDGMENAKRAEGILKLMLKLHAEGHTGIKPDSISFTSVVHAYVKPHGENRVMTPEVADCLENITDILLGEGEDSGNDSDSDSDSNRSNVVSVGRTHGIASLIFGGIIESIGKGGLDDAGIRAKRLLDKMKDAKAAGKIVDSPNTKIYSQVLRCLISNNVSDGDSDSKDNVESITAAMDMIQEMMEGNSSVEPNTNIMNGVLHHYAKNGDVEGAENFFKTMTKLAEEKGYFTRPDVASYNIMANMYFRTRKRGTGMKVYRMFLHMEESYDAGLLFEMELFFYSIVINMLHKSGEISLRQKAYDVLLAAIKRFDEGLLRREPDSIMFNSVFSVLTNDHSDASLKKALELLQLMEDRYAEGFTSAPPDSITYNHVLVALSRNMNMGPEVLLTIFQKLLDLDAEGNDYVEVDKAAYEIVLFGLSNPRHGDRKKSIEIVEQMIKNEKVNLTSQCLDSLLVAHCSEKDRRKGEMAAFDATRCFLLLVERFEKGAIDVLPSREGVHAVMNCWADTKHWKNAKHSIGLYNLMRSLSSKGVEYISPSAKTVSIILKTFSKHNQNKTLKKAKKFWGSVDEELLDVIGYNTFLHIVANSRDLNKAHTARQILDEMEEKGLADTISYNTFLKACALTGGSDENKSKALQLAFETYKEIPSPDDATFATILKACNISDQSGDNKLSQQVSKLIFNDACEKGLLSEKVINELRLKIPSPQREEELGNSLAVEDLKSEWRRNVQKKIKR